MSINAVLTCAGYVLAHAPDMVLHNGTTQTTERIVNPNSEYLKALPRHLREYTQTLNYAPHQVYIGNMTPGELKDIPFPWYDKPLPASNRYGRFGEIMPEDEFIGLMQLADTFDLVRFTDIYAEEVRNKLTAHPLLKGRAADIKAGVPLAEIINLINESHAEPLAVNELIIGCVKRAHDIDVNLSAHVMLENLASKASAALALLHMASAGGIDMHSIDYVIECSEEACGDMNQRGGGNFAKAIAETAGAVNATGCDTRGFCAAPVHALIEAASLIKAGTFNRVAVVAGGATAKLGMNGRDHVKKGLPILEDVLGGFAVLISADDGISPVVNTACVGKHTVGAGSAPQAVISSLVSQPLERAGLKITDVDKYAAELQNPDITKPAGAGDVPEANYKMIAALSVMRKEIAREDIPAFIEKHGMAGFAPTQGHIPSGTPYLGFAREGLTTGELNRVMIIGKGSLFLGRMTNLFDGISVLLERNPGKQVPADKNQAEICMQAETQAMLAVKQTAAALRVGITVDGNEHGVDEMISGALKALAENDGIEVVLLAKAGTEKPAQLHHPRLSWISAADREVHKLMEEMLDTGKINACITMHYNFPIGVSTVGHTPTPGTGRDIYLATTTGAASANRTEAMMLNALYGIAAAKAMGLEAPTVGILNVDGAVQVENGLRTLSKNGYHIYFAESVREDGGGLMRGNDLLRGAADIIVTDTLTGNILMKLVSALTTGGVYESTGSGYGPGLGEHFPRLVLILSRASGAHVAANAILYAARLIKGNVLKRVSEELSAARDAGLNDILAGLHKTDSPDETAAVVIPKRETVTEEIPGIDIMRLEDAVRELWRADIYAESGMGCTGPVVLVNPAQAERAQSILKPYRG